MAKVYILRSYEGSYEDVYQKNIAVFEDEDMAKAAKESKTKEQQDISDKYDEFLQKSDELSTSFYEIRKPELIANGMSPEDADDILDAELDLLEVEYKCDYMWERKHYYIDTVDYIEKGEVDE